MSERYRNDLYYIERMSGATAIYPNGTMGEIQEKKVRSIKTVKGRREDRVRKVAYSQEKLTQTASYDSASAYRVADLARIDKETRKYSVSGEDPSWGLEDMPDSVITKFNRWKNALDTPNLEDIGAAALGESANGDELQNETIECMWCKGGKNSQYACRGCGYTGAYYKYPVIRLEDSDGHYDTPFDVARFIHLNPGALSYEVRTMFNHEGKMAAEQVAVLRITETNGAYADRSQIMQVDQADQLYGEIVVPLVQWREDRKWPNGGFKPLGTSEPGAVIEALQKKCALELVRERLDNEEYQEYYEQFIQKLRKLGAGAMTAVVRSRYEGMGEIGYEMLFGNLPFAGGHDAVVAYSCEPRELFKKIVPLIDADKGMIDFRWEGGY